MSDVSPRHKHHTSVGIARDCLDELGIAHYCRYGKRDNAQLVIEGAICPVRTIQVDGDQGRMSTNSDLMEKVEQATKNGGFLIGVCSNTGSVYAVKQEEITITVALKDGTVLEQRRVMRPIPRPMSRDLAMKAAVMFAD